MKSNAIQNEFVFKEYGLQSSGCPLNKLTDYVFFQEGPGLRNWQWKSEGMKVINITNILGEGIVDTSNTDRHISMSEFYKSYQHFEVQEGDIVIASSGWSYGKVGRIKANNLPLMMNTSVIRFKSNDPNILDDDYLYYFLASPYMKRQIDALITVADKPNFGPYHIKRMSIPLRSIEKQRSIGSILKAYDDSIENNLRRIRLLEEAARCEYKMMMEESESIKNITKIGEVLALNYGKALKSTERTPGNYPVYGSSGIVGTHEKYLIEGPGIILGRKGNVGSVFWTNENFYPIDTVYYISSGLSLYFLYHNLKYDQYFDNSDAAVPGLNRNHALSNKIKIPSTKSLELFDHSCKVYFDFVYNLEKQNKQLRQARNILLPKLMSGEIEVE